MQSDELAPLGAEALLGAAHGLRRRGAALERHQDALDARHLAYPRPADQQRHGRLAHQVVGELTVVVAQDAGQTEGEDAHVVGARRGEDLYSTIGLLLN